MLNQTNCFLKGIQLFLKFSRSVFRLAHKFIFRGMQSIFSLHLKTPSCTLVRCFHRFLVSQHNRIRFLEKEKSHNRHTCIFQMQLPSTLIPTLVFFPVLMTCSNFLFFGSATSSNVTLHLLLLKNVCLFY